MDDLDRKILNALQYDFPMTEHPFDIIAESLGISCDELLERVEKLISCGVIRRIGASFDSQKLGYSSTLAALSIDENQVDRAAELIGQFEEVTHSYLRKDKFNIWFTIIAADNSRIEQILEEIRRDLSLDSSQILNLPMQQVFKIDARFNASS